MERANARPLGKLPVSHLVLGIDPGTASMGYGLVEETDGEVRLAGYGVLTTLAHRPLPERLKDLYDGLLHIIQKYNPTEVAVEELFVRRSLTAARAVYQARGVALLAAAKCGLPVSEYTPPQVKRAVTRYGRASKAQIQEIVRVVLGLELIPQPDDAADALAVAVCHLYSGNNQ